MFFFFIPVVRQYRFQLSIFNRDPPFGGTNLLPVELHVRLTQYLHRILNHFTLAYTLKILMVHGYVAGQILNAKFT